MDVETTQGIAVADVAKDLGLYLVYSSVGSANKKTGIPHFESKWKVEEHIAKIGVQAAILRPVYFMENLTAFTLPQLKEGTVATALPPGRKLAQIALADLGAFGAMALQDRDRFAGKQIDLASDDLTGTQLADTLSRVTGRRFAYFQVPMDMIRKQSEDMALMYEWFERVGYTVDTAALRRDYPEVGWHTFEQWAKVQDWKTLLAR
jgi:uncharacterized protein YbjT (DUF2867 family)